MVNEYTVKNENKRCKKQSGHCGIGVRAGHVPFKLPVPVTVGCTVIFAAGAIYFCILFLISVLVKQGVSMELPKVATTFILCAASGMAGGMIS